MNRNNMVSGAEATRRGAQGDNTGIVLRHRLFETRSHYGTELRDLLASPSKCWDSRQIPPQDYLLTSLSNGRSHFNFFILFVSA